MYEFIAAYFLFLPFYPLAIIESFNRSFLLTAIWLSISALVIFFVTKFDYKTIRKFFISIWIMPGTIVCGAATIAPWPIAGMYIFGDGGCATILSVLATLIFNILLVFSCSKLIDKFRKNKSAQI